ncbi:MAG TPA: MoxR family ATPase [Candidatus Polarisedimenticolia bacterium]|nr:MoxR family ATPase [Candidatus Polarisedimenticolia bacterium]
MSGQVSRVAAHVRAELAKAIVGQREAIDQLLLAVLCGGHVVLEGVPGLAKTLAVKALGRVCQVGFNRVQCTPDLMPADVTGTNMFNMAQGSFTLHRGPIFTDLLLVDEINRTPPRTQAALLEAMEERQVTIDGARHALPPFFTVFATQNPIEFEGTYPLPEAQLDRFLMKIRIGYPGNDEEVEILMRHQRGFDAHDLDRLGLTTLEPALLKEARAEIGGIRVDEALARYIGAVARRTRNWPSLSLGASPRAAVSLMAAAKGLAAMEGRDFLIPDDVKAAAPPVLRHRLILKPEADLDGVTSDQVIADLIAAVEVPR